jgi:hypothetical protein
MREMMHKSFEFRVSSFGLNTPFDRQASPSTAVSSFPRTREVRVFNAYCEVRKLDSGLRRNDEKNKLIEEQN